MARKKVIQETSENNTELKDEHKPVHQVITVPVYIDMDEQFGKIGDSDDNINNYEVMNEPDFIVEMPEPKKFDINIKKYSVFYNQEFLEDVEDGSEKLDFYLNENKKIFDDWKNELNKEVTDPNELIFFHEGPQQRTYLSFHAFYSQNGLAPKHPTINSWMAFYQSQNPVLSEEEIVLGVKGNLPYSFSLNNEE